MSKGKSRKRKPIQEAEVVQFKPRNKRFHVAQEYRDSQNMPVADELVRRLKPKYAIIALGLKEAK